MAVEIIDVKRESCPATRFVGKRYSKTPNWGEWWQNGWFAILEGCEPLPINEKSYIGAMHLVDERPEYWIGMFCAEGVVVPEGFDYVDIEPREYAVFYLYDKDNSKDFYTMDTHVMCLDELKTRGFTRKEDDWWFERYSCPRFTTPDEEGNVILDYAVSIEV